MTSVETPSFLEVPEAARVVCESHQALANGEVACAVRRIGGGELVVITLIRFFDEGSRSLRGTVIAYMGDGRLVDFPSGDRIAVPSDMVININGSAIGS